MQIKGFILDIDGTLLSSKKAHLKAWGKALRGYGIRLSDQDIVAQFGKPTPNISQNLIGTNDPQLANTIAKEKTNFFIEAIGKISLFPKVTKILNLIHENGLPICFASSNYRRVIKTIYREHNWDQISVGYVGIEDVKKSKPHPEMIKIALKKMNVAAEEAVMVGDSIYDVQAGQAAGTKTIAVCTSYTREEWDEFHPDLVLDKFGDLLELLPLEL